MRHQGNSRGISSRARIGFASLTPVLTPVLVLALVLTGPLAAIAAAEPDAPELPVGTGQALPKLQLKDQHDRTHEIDAQTLLVLFAPDRDSSELAHALLEELGGDALAQAGIAYVADISAMPGLVTSIFALPKMRGYSYPLLLGREEADTAALPRRPGEVTLIDLDGGVVTAVRYSADTETLRGELEPYLTR